MDQYPAGEADGGTPPPGSVVAAALARIDAEITAVQAAPLLAHGDGQARDVVAQVSRLRSRLDAAYLHVLADLDRRPGAVPGAAAGRVAATFLVHAVTVAPGRAARDVRAARALDPDGAGFTPDAATDSADGAEGAEGAEAAHPTAMPRLATALAQGAISLAHVDVVVRCLRGVPEHLLHAVGDDGVSGTARVDAFLSEQARIVCPDTLRRIGAQLVATLDPDGEDSYDPNAVQRRRLDYATDATGMLVGSFALDPVAGARLRTVIEALVTAQTPEPGQAVGEAAPGHDQPELAVRDERTASQRRADALHQLCHNALNPTGGEQPATATTQVIVVATPEQVADAMTTTGHDDDADPHASFAGPIDPSEARRADPTPPGLATDVANGPLAPAALAALLCTAVLTGLLADPVGPVLAHGRTRRLATAAQVRALTARDRGCVVPGCTLPPGRCEAHHITWWRHGGATDLDNLVLLCTRHHTAVHTGHWRLTVIDDLPYVIPPPLGRPHRNPTPQHRAHRRTPGPHPRTTTAKTPPPPRPVPARPPTRARARAPGRRPAPRRRPTPHGHRLMGRADEHAAVAAHQPACPPGSARHSLRSSSRPLGPADDRLAVPAGRPPAPQPPAPPPARRPAPCRDSALW